MFLKYLLTDSQPATLARAKCHLLLGNWKIAIQAAEMVLMTDGYNYKGIHIKAEALFNLCYFEHAMVLFHRGTVMFPESEEFQFGVTKCRKTILDGVSKGFRPQYF